VSDNVRWHSGELSRAQRSSANLGTGCTVWLTGFSGSGKSTIAHRLESFLVDSGRAAYCLDGDNVRLGLNGDLGFSPEDRAENVRRVGEVAKLLADAGLVVIAPLISPYEAGRQAVAASHADAGIPFVLVHVSTPIEVCEQRDTKGLYARARAGDVPDFTGISAPYETPGAPALTIDTSVSSLDDAVAAVADLIP